jgi:SSS family transporter
VVASVLTLGVVTAIYTFLGGMTAVIWTDVVQLAVYLTGAVVATGVLVAEIPGGLSGAVAAGAAAGRFVLFDFSFDVTRSYTFWSGVIGGAFLTTATHGTDQLMVQRYLCASSMSRARLALLASGAVVFAQFALFLFIGALLWAFYAGDPAELARFTVAGRTQSDRIFPTFIVDHLPPGVGGLVCAAVFAAAMSTLSSSLNSSAAAAMSDFYMPLTGGGLADRHYLQRSRLLTLAFACVQVAVALLAIRISTRVVDEVLGIASFTNGLILGVFLLGTFSPGLPQRYALAGMSAGLSTMLVVRLATPVSWQWYVLLGSLVTFLVARAAARAGGWRQDAAAR